MRGGPSCARVAAPPVDPEAERRGRTPVIVQRTNHQISTEKFNLKPRHTPRRHQLTARDTPHYSQSRAAVCVSLLGLNQDTRTKKPASHSTIQHACSHYTRDLNATANVAGRAPAALPIMRAHRKSYMDRRSGELGVDWSLTSCARGMRRIALLCRLSEAAACTGSHHWHLLDRRCLSR